MGLYSMEKLRALPANHIQRQKCLVMKNTPAYSGVTLFTVVKSFMAQTLGESSFEVGHKNLIGVKVHFITWLANALDNLRM
jgi:hypothetical protein